jgi:seryl-tRNA synthetase
VSHSYHFPKTYAASPLEAPMLDAAFVRQHLEAVKANCRNRLAANAEVDRVVALDDQRKKLISETQVLQQRANEISQLIPKEKDAAKKQ